MKLWKVCLFILQLLGILAGGIGIFLYLSNEVAEKMLFYEASFTSLLKMSNWIYPLNTIIALFLIVEVIGIVLLFETKFTYIMATVTVVLIIINFILNPAQILGMALGIFTTAVAVLTAKIAF